ncbi:hypothetical protein D3C81_876200 [compost metagenome]
MRFIQLGFIYTFSGVVIDRQQLYMRYAKTCYMVQPGRDSLWPLSSTLRQPKVFTGMLGTAISMNRQIPYVQLVNNRIQMRNKCRLVIRPTFRISTAQIQNGRLISVNCYRLSIRISRLAPDLANLDAIRVQRILAILSYSQYPGSLDITNHWYFTDRCSVPGLVEYDHSLRSRWCPKSELGSLR